MTNRLANVPGDFRRASGLSGRLWGQFLFQNLGKKFNAGQLLAQSIVQILTDTSLLTATDLQNLLFKMLALRDLPDESGKNPAFCQLYFADR